MHANFIGIQFDSAGTIYIYSLLKSKKENAASQNVLNLNSIVERRTKPRLVIKQNASSAP